jgi:hypothetical protein
MQRLKELLRLKISSSNMEEEKINLSESNTNFNMTIVSISTLHNEA